MSAEADKVYQDVIKLVSSDQLDSGKAIYNAIHTHLDRTWAECYRVLKPGGFICVNVGDIAKTVGDTFQLYTNHSRVIQAMEALGCQVLPSITWRTPSKMPTKFMGSGMLPGGAYATVEHEWILIFRKPGKRDYNKHEKETRSQSAIFWHERNTWYTDQWHDIEVDKQLPLPKKLENNRPLDIALRPILMHTMYGDTILDPFASWGKTSLAAMLSGRNSISIESNEKLIDHSLTVPTKRGTKDYFNETLDKRVLAHLGFIEEKDLLFFRYKNTKHGFPVKTQQERNLTLYPVKSISKLENIVTVKYRNYKSSEMEGLLSESRL